MTDKVCGRIAGRAVETKRAKLERCCEELASLEGLVVEVELPCSMWSAYGTTMVRVLSEETSRENGGTTMAQIMMFHVTREKVPDHGVIWS